MASRKWLIVGISGATCSGKTLLAKKLHKDIKDSVLVQQDDYFFPSNDPRHIIIPEFNHQNWEILSSLDIDKMHSDILKIIASNPCGNNGNSSGNTSVLILEGFLLFECESITKLCDLKYFLTLPKDICWERRNNRIYEPADPPGYFEKAVWPEYVRYESNIRENKNLSKTTMFIAGSENKEKIFEMVFTEIKKRLC